MSSFKECGFLFCWSVNKTRYLLFSGPVVGLLPSIRRFPVQRLSRKVPEWVVSIGFFTFGVKSTSAVCFSGIFQDKSWHRSQRKLKDCVISRLLYQVLRKHFLNELWNQLINLKLWKKTCHLILAEINSSILCCRCYGCRRTVVLQ